MSIYPSPKATLWALLIGNFLIGTGVLLPAGLLSDISADLAISPAHTGWLMTLGGLIVGFGAPAVAALTAQVDRRVLLTLAIGCYVIGHLGAALSPGLTGLLIFRALAVAGAAAFTPQAAATVGLIVPAKERGSAIAFIFIGWSLASVIGIPLATLAGEAIGWRETYLIMSALSAITMAMVWLMVPTGLRVTPLSLAIWRQVLTDRRLLLVLLVTAAAMAGQFTVFTYIAPILKDIYGLSGNGAALAFCLAGAFGVTGNWLASRQVGRYGPDRVVLLSLGCIGAGMALAIVGWGSLTGFVAGLCLWNLGGFAVNSMQQARLVGLAPMLASATIALNTSFVYLGQAGGSATGGVLIASAGPGPHQLGVAVGFVALAAGISLLAARAARA